MRHALLAAIALVVGLVVGGLFPRAEVRALEARIDEMQEQECAPRRTGEELATLLTRRPVAPAPDPEPPPATDDGAPEQPPAGAAPVAPPAGEPAERPVDEIAAMQEALDLRRTQARASLVEDADPDPRQLDDFDAAVADMNDELAILADEAVARVREYGEPTRHEMMVFAADTLDVLITAEERMWGSLSDGQLAAVEDEALDPFSYVEPALLDRFAELDAELDQ